MDFRARSRFRSRGQDKDRIIGGHAAASSHRSHSLLAPWFFGATDECCVKRMKAAMHAGSTHCVQALRSV